LTFNVIHELTHALNAGHDHIAAVQESPRIEAESDAGGRSSRDDIPGLERKSSG
jgi:hypothetical protein